MDQGLDRVPTALSRSALALALAWLAASSTGCGPARTPLANTSGTTLELATAVLGAFERRDLGALRSLALNEREFREHVWPELPAARPERNLPVSYVWGDLHQKSEASLGRLLGTLGGQRLVPVSIAFPDGTTPYQSYLVHRKAVVRVRDGSGAERDIRAFGSVLAKDGRFKVFSYVVDDD